MYGDNEDKLSAVINNLTFTFHYPLWKVTLFTEKRFLCLYPTTKENVFAVDYKTGRQTWEQEK